MNDSSGGRCALHLNSPQGRFETGPYETIRVLVRVPRIILVFALPHRTREARPSPGRRGHPEGDSRSLPKPLEGDDNSCGSHKPTQEPTSLVSDLRLEFCFQQGEIGLCHQVPIFGAKLCLQRGCSFLFSRRDSFLRAFPENTRAVEPTYEGTFKSSAALRLYRDCGNLDGVSDCYPVSLRKATAAPINVV